MPTLSSYSLGCHLYRALGGLAFREYAGKLTFIGEYPALVTIGTEAFRNIDNADSVITLNGLPSLQSIEGLAFHDFRGKLTFTGEYPALETFGNFAFESGGNGESVVAIACSSPAGLTIADGAFNKFKGTRDASNEFRQCIVTTATTSTLTTATTTIATTPTATTSAATLPVATGSTDSTGKGGTVAAITIVLLLVVSAGVVFAIRCKQQQQQRDAHGYQNRHHPPAVAVNPGYTIGAETGRSRGSSVVATDSNQRQFSIPMEETPRNNDHGAGQDAVASTDYLVPVTQNADYTYAPPMPSPTAREGAATTADYAEIDDGVAAGIARDADGYVVDDFSPDQGAGGDPAVYATYGRSGGNNVDVGAAAPAEYAVPASDGGAVGVYTPAAIVESNV